MMEKRPSRVSEAQWAILLEFLEKNPNLVKARGYNNSAKGRQESARQWHEIAEVLNAEGLGTTKTAKDWSVYVSNYKSKLKKVVADLNADASATGGGPSQACSTHISNMDARFLAIMGPGFGQSVPTVRVNPFPDELQQPSSLPTTISISECIPEEFPEPGQEEVVSQDRSRSRSPVIQPFLEEAPGEEAERIESAAAAGPRLPRQARQPRYRTRPLAPIDEARRILSQVELQRAAADAEKARALLVIGQNLGRLAAAMEEYVAHIRSQSE